jgi:hypothetical protein
MYWSSNEHDGMDEKLDANKANEAPTYDLGGAALPPVQLLLV